jgi:dCTP deaminase
VRIGHYLYREQRESGNAYFNPFSEDQVRSHWGTPQEASSARVFMKKFGRLEGVRDRDHVIVLAPGETILCHTIEFIGGRNCVSTEMRARSSMGRIGITVCKCAGWGDLGYVNRWTMELTNHLRDTHLVLIEGMRVAQLIFMKVDPIKAQQTYAGSGGKYQTTDDLTAMMRKWHPDGMLPKLFKDYEKAEGFPNDSIRVTLQRRR